MIDMHLKFDNMHKNRIFYALIFINNHIISCIDFMLSTNKCYWVDRVINWQDIWT